MESLRAAFNQVTQDPAFLAEANKQNLELDVMSGKELQSLIAEIGTISPEALEKAKSAVDIKKK